MTSAGQSICYPTNDVCIDSAKIEDIELALNAIKKAYDFFRSIGYPDRYFCKIAFQKEVVTETMNGELIRVVGKLSEDNIIYITDWLEPWLAEQNAYGLKMSKAFYESLIIHEIAHFIANKTAGHKIDKTLSEYIAYTIQLSLMQPKMRQAILSKHHVPAFKTEEIHLDIMLINPAVFAIKSYLHFKESRGKYLKQILIGAITKPSSIAYWDHR